MRIAVLDAPTNLGLRPPSATSVPGCAKAPGALRDHGLVARLGARDAGCLTPPRFDPGAWRPGDGVSQAKDIAWYSTRLADRIGEILVAGEFPLILGGDCSVAIGSMLAMKRLEPERGGRVGLVYVDAHSDFRHPGNASVVGAAAGEALALVTGRGQGDLASIEQRRPYVRDSDVVVIGMRSTDDYRMDLQAGGFNVRTAQDVRTHGANRTAQWARSLLAECMGYWVHLDVDVLDPSVMPAVDAPTPGGIAYPELEHLLQGLVTVPQVRPNEDAVSRLRPNEDAVSRLRPKEDAVPRLRPNEDAVPRLRPNEDAVPECLGLEVTVFDPDFDFEPPGAHAQDLVNTIVAALAPVSQPPVVAIPTQAKRATRPRRTPASS